MGPHRWPIISGVASEGSASSTYDESWVPHPSRSLTARWMGNHNPTLTGRQAAANSAIPSPMNYRLFQREDFDDLYAIEEICFQPPQRFTRRYMRQIIASQDAATWIAEHDGHMAGFAIVEWAQADHRRRCLHRHHRSLARLCAATVSEPNYFAASKAPQTPKAPARSGFTSTRKIPPRSTSMSASGYHSRGRADHYYARNRPAAIYLKHLV